MQKEVLKAVLVNEENMHTVICGNGVEMISAWLALSDAVARALEEKPLLKGSDQRQAMLAILTKSFEGEKFVKRATDDDNDCDDCSDCGHCDSQHECSFFNKAIEQGMSKEEVMLLTLLGKVLSGENEKRNKDEEEIPAPSKEDIKKGVEIFNILAKERNLE